MGNKKEKIVTVNIERENQQKAFTKNFNKLLNKYLQKGHNKKDLADKLGVSQSAITNYTKGDFPKRETIEAIGNFFNVTADFLIGKEKNPSHTGEQIYNMIGLSENAVIYLCSLRHNNEDIVELEDLNRNLPISNVYNELLETLSLFIEDRKYLAPILNKMRHYTVNKKKLSHLEKNNENNFFDNEEVFTLKRDLRYTLDDIKELLQMHLNYVVELQEKEEQN